MLPHYFFSYSPPSCSTLSALTHSYQVLNSFASPYNMPSYWFKPNVCLVCLDCRTLLEKIKRTCQCHKICGLQYQQLTHFCLGILLGFTSKRSLSTPHAAISNWLHSSQSSDYNLVQYKIITLTWHSKIQANRIPSIYYHHIYKLSCICMHCLPSRYSGEGFGHP